MKMKKHWRLSCFFMNDLMKIRFGAEAGAAFQRMKDSLWLHQMMKLHAAPATQFLYLQTDT
jgi:hypothetical protein